MPEISLNDAQEAARRFVLDEAGFAQLTTIDARGYPVTRTMTAFLQEDWSVQPCSAGCTAASTSGAEIHAPRWSGSERPGPARPTSGRTSST